MAALAVSAYERGDYDAMAGWAGQARATDSPDPLVRGVGLPRLRSGTGSPGREAEAATEADSPCRPVRGDRRGAGCTAELLAAVPWALVAVERLEDALRTARRGSAAAQAGNVAAAVPMLVVEVLALGLLGRIGEAVAAADRTEARGPVDAQRAVAPVGAVDAGMGAARPRRRGRRDRPQPPRASPSPSISTSRHWSRSATRSSGRRCSRQAGRPRRGRCSRRTTWSRDGSARWAPRLVEAELALG